MLIDLDDTLYRVEEMPVMVRANIQKYMMAKLDIPQEGVEETTQELYVKYGTTMAGLAALGYKIDFDDFHTDVHGTLEYKHMLKPDPALHQLLQSIPLPKYIFTNADIKHTDICLDILGIRDCFQGIVCFESLNQAAAERGITGPSHPVLCKPDRRAFRLALDMVGATAEETVFLDDSTRNVESAHECGIYSVLVGRKEHHAGADLTIPTIHELPAAMPELFATGQNENELEAEMAVPIAVAAS